jgi:hypothetical protein
VLYGKAPHLRLISASTGGSLRPHAVYGVLSWRTMWNARHVPGRDAILSAINPVLIRGVNAPNAALERLPVRLLCWRTTDNDMACNTLPYKQRCGMHTYLMPTSAMGCEIGMT